MWKVPKCWHVQLMDALSSPCIKQCKLDEYKTYCVSCGRSLEEITNWSKISDEQKLLVLKRLGK